MSEFLTSAFTFPTAIFSVLLALLAVYWLLALLTGLDLEILESLFEGAEGAADGLAEGLGEGLAEGALEGAGEGLEGGDGSDGDAEGRGGCLRLIGVGEVPIVLTLTLLTGFAWAASYGGTELVARGTGLAAGGLAAGLLVLVAASVVAFGATALALVPLRRLMRFEPATARSDLVGRTCLITTQSVDDRFGQAEVVDDQGTAILIQARCPEANELRRGSRALVFDYDRENEVFLVAPLGGELDV